MLILSNYHHHHPHGSLTLHCIRGKHKSLEVDVKFCFLTFRCIHVFVLYPIRLHPVYPHGKWFYPDGQSEAVRLPPWANPSRGVDSGAGREIVSSREAVKWTRAVSAVLCHWHTQSQFIPPGQAQAGICDIYCTGLCWVFFCCCFFVCYFCFVEWIDCLFFLGQNYPLWNTRIVAFFKLIVCIHAQN